MSQESNGETAEDDIGFRYVPNFKQGSAQNTAYRDQNGVQTGILNGDVTMNSFGPYAEPDLVVRRATDDEVEQARQQFAEPGGFARAKRIIQDHNVVVLCGAGTGRTFAARRLLVDCGTTAIVDMNRYRQLGSIRANELKVGLGYIWSVGDGSGKPFLDWEFEQCASLVKAAGCQLVIVVDHRSQSCTTASSQTVDLEIPDLVEVALCHIRWRCGEAVEGPAMVLKYVAEFVRTQLDAGRGPVTLRRCIATLSSALNDAVRQRRLTHNAAKYAVIPLPAPPQRACWTPGEAVQFLQHCASPRSVGRPLRSSHRHRHAQRRSTLALHWNDVHLEDRVLFVHQTLSNVNNTTPVFTAPKTRTSLDWVALSSRVIAALQRQAERQHNQRLAAGGA